MKKPQLNVILSEDLIIRVRRRAVAEQVTINELAEKALEKLLSLPALQFRAALSKKKILGRKIKP